MIEKLSQRLGTTKNMAAMLACTFIYELGLGPADLGLDPKEDSDR